MERLPGCYTVTENHRLGPRVVKHIHAEHAKPLGAEAMAQRAGMNVSAFHHDFKLVTSSSPLDLIAETLSGEGRGIVSPILSPSV